MFRIRLEGFDWQVLVLVFTDTDLSEAIHTAKREQSRESVDGLLCLNPSPSMSHGAIPVRQNSQRAATSAHDEAASEIDD